MSRDVHSMHSDPVTNAQPEHKGLRWDASDVAFLQPNNLRVPKTLHAWERKPAVPFTKQRMRAGKVWKREVALNLGVTTRPTTLMERLPHKRAKMMRQSGQYSPLKPVKKLCVESDFGLGAKVLQWECHSSPDRKIVTRSHSSGFNLVALREAQEVDEFVSDETEDATIEVIDEQGKTTEVIRPGMETSDDWEDEPEEALDMAVPDHSDGQNWCHDSCENTISPPNEEHKAPCEHSENVANSIDQQRSECSSQSLTNHGNEHESRSLDEFAVETQAKTTLLVEHEEVRNVVTLPDGFVSPIRSRKRFTARSRVQSQSSRRTTLPVQSTLVPESSEPMSGTVHTTSIPSRDKEYFECMVSSDALEDASIASGGDRGEAVCDTAVSSEDEWEEIEEHTPSSNDEEQHELTSVQDQQQDDIPGVEDGEVNMYTALPTTGTTETKLESLQHTEIDVANSEMTPSHPNILDFSTPDVAQSSDNVLVPSHMIGESARISSQGPSIQSTTDVTRKDSLQPNNTDIRCPNALILGDCSPRPVLRTSPRRKSSSPIKNHSSNDPSVTSHLIAFSPVKKILTTSPLCGEVGLDDHQPVSDHGCPGRRAASAPPEVLQQNPSKSIRPRPSDDTELLQAFLSKAAESRRQSISQRESAFNRRDSDTIRQAFAENQTSGVLADMDPNSPAQRRAAEAEEMTDTFPTAEAYSPLDKDPLSLADSLAPGVRRSERTKRASLADPQKLMYKINKLALGRRDGIVLKRTEAQELALVTRNNTQRNKGNAIPPHKRLSAIALAVRIDSDDDQGDEPETKPSVKLGKNVTWAEVLVQSDQDEDHVNARIASDEGHDMDFDEPTSDDRADSTAPPPSETPSKPKGRRTKSTRARTTTATESMIVQTDMGFHGSSTTEDKPTTSKSGVPPSQSTRRKSRIATPVRKQGLPTSPLPEDVGTANVEQFGDANSMGVKPPAFKLPPATNLFMGKENLTVSAPKKKVASVASSKSLMPKLDVTAPKGMSGKVSVGAPASVKLDGDRCANLSSPAKKPGRRLNNGGNFLAREDVSSSQKELPPSLSSPAKKRIRRQ